MSNDLILYTASSGLQIPNNELSVSALMSYNKALKTVDAQKFIKAVDSGLYDMAAEYLWSRTINILKRDILQFGNEFVAEMLDRPNGDMESISEHEIIILSADLGFINNTAKMEFLQYSEIIQHYMSNEDPTEEYPSTKLVDMVRSCIKHVLGMETIEYEVPFVSFRDKLKTEAINSSHPIYIQLSTSPYFYKKTITKTLLNLSKTLSDSAERENVFANLVNIIPSIWEALSTDDKWSIGRSYAQANNDGDANFSRALKSLLIKVKGFDFVPENLRSNSYLTAAKDLLSAHFGMNNFYNEPAYAKVLLSMGTSIPMPAFGATMTSVLACKLGNRYGVSWDAQLILDEILDRVNQERWRYYLSNCLLTDEVILYKLINSDCLSRFKNIIDKYKLNEIRFTNAKISQLIQEIYNNNIIKTKRLCEGLLSNLREV